MSDTSIATDGDGGTTDVAGETGGAVLDGGGAEDWRTALPDDMRDHTAFKSIKDVGGLAKSYLHAQQLLGAPNKIALPAADAGEEAWGDFYKAIGRPDTAAEYQLQAPENLPEGMSYSEETAAHFKEMAHAAGLTPQQASIVHDQFIQNVAGLVESAAVEDAARIGEAHRTLQQSWGNAYERNLTLANRAISVLGGDELLEALTAGGMLTPEGEVKDPRIAMAFAEAGKMLGEDVLIGQGDGELPGATQAKQELETFEADPENRKILLDPNHPRRQELMDRRTRLAKLAYPE